MDFLKYLKTISEEEMKLEVSSIINMLEEESKKINKRDFFGFNISSKSSNYSTGNSSIQFDMKCMYDGYIPKDLKVIYGFSIDQNKLLSNNGMYYKVDDDSYIYDFCKYIKDKDVYNEEDFFEYVLIFLMNYFGTFKFKERDDMFKLILKNDMTCHDSVREHKLSDFKGKGNALCSEYSILANNILNVFDIYSCVLFGLLEITDKGKEGHAFNLVSYKDSETNERVNALVDFSNGVNVYDFSYNKRGVSPYIIYLDSIEDAVNGFICDDIHITGKEYDYMVVGRTLLQMFTDRNRDYSSYNNLTVNLGTKTKQK